MNCNRIQELILTDYLDGIIKEGPKKQVEDHLARCPQCLEFARTARKTAFESFERLEKTEPPAHLWSRIENAIMEENRPVVDQSPSWIERLKLVFANPRPVVAFVAVLALFIAAGTVRQFEIQKTADSSQSIEYFVSLIEPSTEVSSSETEDFGTTVEQYFL